MKRNLGWVKQAGFVAALALLLVLASAPAALADGSYSYSDGLVTWAYTATGSSAAITGVTLHSDSIDTLVIPEYVPSGASYVPVTSVGGFSGIGTASISTVIIPRHVTAIADNAFKNCSGIKSFDLRCGGLKTIGAYAFYWVNLPTAIDLPDSVTSIGGLCFFSDDGTGVH